MVIAEKIKPEWPLRIGFAAMYIYSGTDIIRNPHNWSWAVPDWFGNLVSHMMPVDTYLKFQGAGELLFALVFLAWFLSPRFVRWITLLATAEMAGILLFNKAGIDQVTFRDLGLLGGLVCLYLILGKKELTKEAPRG